MHMTLNRETNNIFVAIWLEWDILITTFMNIISSRILCIGALHLDHEIQCVGDTILGESNPAHTTKSCGGVAFNIAKSLTHLECVSGLASSLGKDQTGTGLLNYLAKTKIELTDIGSEPGKHTAAYTAILDTDGGLIIGLADMEIYNLMDDQYWSRRIDKLGGWDAWCLDTNLPESGLQYLVSLKNRPPLYLVASSPSKALRIKSLLQDINTLILNLEEANAIIGQSYRDIGTGKNAARMLCTAGVNRAIVTLGAKGAAWADKNGSGAIGSPIKNKGPVRTSGAGDTLAAVTIAALEKGLSTPQALELGVLGSHHFMHTSDPSTPITWTKLTTCSTIDYE